MKSEWKVSSMIIGDKKIYQVYRLRDANATDHSGNREYDDMYLSGEVAQMQADALNRKEKEMKP